MEKKKQPYAGYSELDVTIMEGNYYILQFGNDFMSREGSFLFTKKEMTRLYKRTVKNLMGIIANGSPKDRKHALKLMSQLIVQPMRLH